MTNPNYEQVALEGPGGRVDLEVDNEATEFSFGRLKCELLEPVEDMDGLRRRLMAIMEEAGGPGSTPAGWKR